MSVNLMAGTSGFSYKAWRGSFYPDKLKESDMLAFYAQHFGTVELNNTFYRLPSEASLVQWRDQVPTGFRFSVKATRVITHIKRLKDVADVELGSRDYEFRGRVNGASATLVGIFLQPGTNALEVADEVNSVMDELSARFPEGLEHNVVYDTTRFVKVSIEEVVKTLLEAMLLVIAARRRGEYVPGRVIRILGNPVLAGGTITYKLTVSNFGPSTAQNVQVVDSLPPGVTELSYANNFKWGSSDWNTRPHRPHRHGPRDGQPRPAAARRLDLRRNALPRRDDRLQRGQGAAAGSKGGGTQETNVGRYLDVHLSVAAIGDRADGS